MDLGTWFLQYYHVFKALVLDLVKSYTVVIFASFLSGAHHMVDQAPTNNKTTTANEVECVTTNATAVEGDKAAAPVVAAVGSEETAPVDLNALAPAAGEEKPDEVCEVPGRQAASAEELANAILVSKPAAGETKQYAAVADGQTYNFDFNYKDALVETEGKNVVIRFADGAVVVLEDFAAKASATKLIVDNCEAEPIQFASLNNIAPAAGAAPAAAGPQANAVVGNTGAGFNEFNAGNLPGVNNPLGPLGGTQLSYGLIDGLRPEFGTLPLVDGNPNGLVGVGDPLNLVDETGGGGTSGDFSTPRVTGGTIGFDYGPDGAGSVRIIDGPTGLTHRGEPISTTVSADGLTATGTTASGDVVFVFTINPANGTYTFTLNNSLDHPIAGNPNEFLDLPFVIRVTDADGDFADGTATMRVFDDAPSAVTAAGNSGTVDETDGNNLGASGTLTYSYGGDGAGNIKLVGGPAGLTSGGVPVLVTVTDGVVTGTANGVTVFTLTLNQATGAWSYQQLAPLDHADINNPNDVLNLGFTVRVTDYDGDFVDTPINVAVLDDGPMVDKGVNAVLDESDGMGSISGTAPISFGQDGPGEVRLSNGPAGLTSGGQAIAVTVGTDGSTAVGKLADGTIVFELTLNKATGAYTFTQFAPLDHANPNDPNDALNLNFAFTVTDSEGDSAVGNIGIVVLDDGPTAGTAALGVTDLGTTITGTLPHDFGADGAGSIKLTGNLTGLTSNGQAVTVTVTDSGAVGKLTDGTVVFTFTVSGSGYSFVQNADLDGNPVLNLGYTVTDNDGDTAAGTITVSSRIDGLPEAGVTAASVDETGGFDSVNGTLPFSFGPDGAGSVKLTTVPAGLTSGGQPVVVTVSADGQSATGKVGDVTVFTLTINGSTGAYTFTQLVQLDHPNTADHNDTLGLGFGFTVTDSDGDVANGGLNVTVYDDGPSAGSVSVSTPNGTGTAAGSVSGTLPYAYGADGAGSVKLTGVAGNFTVDGQAVTVNASSNTITGTLANGTPVFSLVFNGTGYTYTQYMNIDGNPKLDFSYQVTDKDGDTATGHLNVQSCHDGAPTAAVVSATVDETGGFDSVSGNLAYNYGSDGAGSVAFTTVPTGLTSHGVPVVVTVSADGLTATGVAGGVTVFTATITNTATGAYTFTQLAALDHPDTSNPDDVLGMNFGFTVTDADGDSANGNLVVFVKDDGPSVGSATLNVDETNATDTVGTANDGIWATATSGTPLSATGNINVSFGQDGKGSVQLTGGPTGLTHHGAAVGVTLVEGGAIGKLSDGTLVFQLSLNKDGSYTFKQYASLDHADSSDHNDLLSLGFGVKVTDFDGDSVTGTLTINVRDDGPCAVDECFCIDQAVVCPPGTNFLFSTTGALDFTYGDDGKGMINLGNASGTITVGGQPVQFIHIANATTEVILGKTAGGQTVFSFTLKADGTYNYEQYAVIDTPLGGANLHFGYTVVDGDNDCDTGAINICFTGRPDGQPTADVIRISVDETGGFDSVSGNLPYNFGPDGAGSVTFTTTPTGLTSKGLPVVVTISADGLTATGVAGGVAVFTATITNPATGAYTFTQLAALDHPNAADHNDTLALGFGFKVTDADGDVANGALNVTVYDDGPSAGSASITGATIGSGAVTGSLPSSYGLDGAGSLKLTGGVTGLTSGGQPITVTVTDGSAVGKLASGVVVFTLTVTGSSYSYVQSASIDGNPTFGLGYTVKDADGDTAKGTISITATTADGYPCVGVSENTVVDETGGFDSVTGNLNYQYGSDGAGTVKFTSGPTGLTSKGVPVVVTISADGLTATGKAGGVDVFKAVLNPATGKYTFTQLAQLDHPNAADHNDSVDLRFGFQVSDRDGDTADGFFKVKVYDDGPQAVGAPGAVIDETSAVDTVGSKTDGIWATPTSGTPLQATGKLTLSFGQDGAGSVQLSGGPTGLTHHGQAVTVSTSGNTATGKLADGTVIFTLALANDGSYTFKQYGSLDHPNAADHNDPLSFGFTVKVTDYDGDTATTSLGITIKDDGPCAADEEFCIDQCEFVDDCNPLTPLVTVNGKLDFTYGNDGAGEIKVNGLQGSIFSGGQAVTTTITTAVVGGLLVTTATGKLASGETIYTLTVNPDGGYAYKQYAAIDTCGCGGSESTLKFDYTVIDADKDCDAGQINICITGTYSESVAPSISVSVVHVSDGCTVVSNLTVVVTDPDSTTMSAANVHLFGQSGDLLQLSNGYAVVNGNVMRAGVDTGIDFTRLSDGGFHLAGSGTVADYQGIMDSVILTATSNQLASRNISFDVTDNTGLNSPTAMVNFYPTPFEPGPTPLISLAEVDPDAGLANLGLRSQTVISSTLSASDATELNPQNTWSPKTLAGTGEKLDISQVLEGNCESYEDLSQFVKVETVEGNTVVSVDSTGSGEHFTQVAVLTGVTGYTLDSMIADGSLEVGRFHG
jgi:T1SS-143 domain-containing protein